MARLAPAQLDPTATAALTVCVTYVSSTASTYAFFLIGNNKIYNKNCGNTYGDLKLTQKTTMKNIPTNEIKNTKHTLIQKTLTAKQTLD